MMITVGEHHVALQARSLRRMRKLSNSAAKLVDAMTFEEPAVANATGVPLGFTAHFETELE